MIARRPVALDVSNLPTTAFGDRDIMWWGTLGFVVIEGFTLMLCAVAYIYLRKNFTAWPPEGIDRPDRLVPTLHALVMLLSLPIMNWLKRAGEANDLRNVRLGLTIGALLCLVFCVVRYYELTQSLNVRWDANAYGSAQWLLGATHGTLLAVMMTEVGGMAAIFWLGPVEKKHFSDAADVAFYWFFVVSAWIPLYLLSFMAPHWIR